MQMPQRTDAHRRMEMMAGNWTGTETIYPSPWDPAGGEATSRVENRVALDGLALVQEYAQTRGGSAPTFRGHAVLRWDDHAQEYVFHWFDSVVTQPSEFRGNFDGDTLTLVRREPRGSARARYEFDGDRYTYRMDVSGDGENWTPFLEGSYQREG
jgi:hypothetical protein